MFSLFESVSALNLSFIVLNLINCLFGEINPLHYFSGIFQQYLVYQVQKIRLQVIEGFITGWFIPDSRKCCCRPKKTSLKLY